MFNINYYLYNLPKLYSNLIGKVNNINRNEGTITCFLPEFSNLEATILNGKNTRKHKKLFNDIHIDDLIVVVCKNIDKLDDKYLINLEYSHLTDDEEKLFIDHFKKITNIINIISVKICQNYFNTTKLNYNELFLNNNNLDLFNQINNILNLIVKNKNKDELFEYFYNDTNQLHSDLNNNVYKFDNSLIETIKLKFPKTKYTLNIEYLYNTNNCFGTNNIISHFNNLISNFNENTIKITLISPPLYNIIIKDNNINLNNYTNYLSNFNNDNIISCHLISLFKKININNLN